MNKYTWSAILIIVTVLLASSASVIYFYLSPQAGLTFVGRHYLNSQDVYTYVSFIEQAKQGRVLFENLYTTEAQSPSLLRPSFLVIGQVARLINTPSIVAYHASRILLSLFFCFVLYRFLKHFFEGDRDRLLAYTLILTSSGLGLFLARWFPDSTDLWIPESNTFLMLGEAPHFILSQILMLLGYGSFLHYLKDQKIWRILWASLLCLILSFEHPFNLVVIAPVLFVTTLWSQRGFSRALILAALSGLGLFYQYYTTLANPILASWQAQNVLLSPAPYAYLIGYGGIVALSLMGTEKMVKGDHLTTANKLLLTWTLISALALYAPLSFQRRLVEGLHIPLTILATYGLLFVLKHYAQSLHRRLIVAVIITLSLTSLYMVVTDFRQINQDQADNYYYHIDPAEIEGLTWLGAHTTLSDTILSNWYIGNLIPGMIGRKVYLGHQIQTTDWNGKNAALDEFVANTNPDTSQQFLQEHGITYIFLGKNDILLKNGFRPDHYPNLTLVYDQGGVSIYQFVARQNMLK